MSKRAPPAVRVTQRLVGDGQTKDEVLATWALLLAKALARKLSERKGQGRKESA